MNDLFEIILNEQADFFGAVQVSDTTGAESISAAGYQSKPTEKTFLNNIY